MKYTYLFCLFLFFGVTFAAYYDPDASNLSESFEQYYEEYWNNSDFMNAYAVADYLDNSVDLKIENDIEDDIDYSGDNIIKEDIGELVNYLNQFNIEYTDIIDISYVNIIHKQATALDSVVQFDQTQNNLFIMINNGFKADTSLSSNETINNKDVNVAIIYKNTDFVYKSSFAVSYIDGKNHIEDRVQVTTNVNNGDAIDSFYRGVNFVFVLPVLADSKLFLGGSYLFAQNKGTRYIKEVGNYNTVTTDDTLYSDDINYSYNTNYYSTYAKLNIAYELSKTIAMYNNIEFNVIGSLGETSFEESDSDYALNVEIKAYTSREISYQIGLSNYIDNLSSVHFNIAAKFTYYLTPTNSEKKLSFVQAEEDYPNEYWLMKSNPFGNFEYSFFLSFFIGSFSIQYYISRRDRFINNSFMLYYGMRVGTNY